MKYFYKYLVFCMLLFCSASGFSQILLIEDFNSSTNLPQGWLSPTLPAFTVTSTNACAGNGNAARGPLSSSSISPELIFTSQIATGTDIEVSFDYKIVQNATSNPATDENFGSFALEYSIDDGKNWITYFTINQQTHVVSTSCTTISHIIPGASVPAGSEFGWRIKGTYTQGNNYIYIDNFQAIEQVACLKPIDLKLESRSLSSIEISWTDINTTPATEWEIAYCPEGINPSNPACFLFNIITVTTNPYTIINLPDGRKYDIYVRTVCAAGSESAWSKPLRVQTVAIGTDCSVPLEIVSLPYTHTSDTEIYDNDYSSSPGASCGVTGNYLAGYDVVYHYYSTIDNILQIELSGNLTGDVGVFVYESCADIKNQCFAGAITANGADFAIRDLSVEIDKDYYIVISSAGVDTSTEYTLDIKGFDCLTWGTPAGDATYDFYNQTLADFSNTRVGVNPTIRGASLAWYSDSTLTTEIVDLNAIVLSNNDEFWVVQTVLDCTSPALHVTFTGFDCTTLEVVSASADSMICDEGTTILRATATSDNFVWYGQEVGGVALRMGTSMQTPVITETTSFWVSEFFRGEGKLVKQANPGPVSASGYTTNSGVEFELYEPTILEDVQVYVTGAAGDITVRLLDAKGSVQEKTFNVPGGTISKPKAVVLPLDFEINNPEDGPFQLIKASGPEMLGTPSTQANYPYPIGTIGIVTKGVTGTSSSTNYFYFYNWTVIASIPLCESERVEVVAIVNETKPISVTAEEPFVCVGNQVEVTVASIDENYQYSWEWIDENGITQRVQGNTINPTMAQGTTFYVSAVNQNTGCSTEGDVFVDVVGVSNVPINPVAASVCLGGIVQLNAGEIIHTFDIPSTGWTYTNASTPADGINPNVADWKRMASPYTTGNNITITSNDGSEFMMVNADALGPGSSVNAEMVSPSINLVGVANASLEFYHYYQYHSTKRTEAKVFVSGDAGLTWDTKATYTTNRGAADDFEKITIDLDEYAGRANVQIKFAYTGAWGWWWAIDNVAVSQTYFNGQVSWMGDRTDLLYLDENISVPYNGQSVNTVYFRGEEEGTFEYDIDLYIEGCGNPVINSVTIDVSKVEKPIGDAVQEFNAGARVSDIKVQGESLLYYLLIDGEYVRQSINTLLVGNEIYYITQRVGACVSEYLEIEVKIVCPQATGLEVVAVDLASNTLSASAIIFWEHPRNINAIEGYQIIVREELTGQVMEDKVVSNRVNYLVIDALPLEQKYTVELYSICDETNNTLSDPILTDFDTIELGIEDFNKFNLTVYPNPTQDYLTIVSDQVLEKLMVVTKEGRKVMLVEGINKEEIQLDLSTLATGTYLVLAKIGSQEKVIRVIKK